MKNIILAYDLGTSGLKAVALDENGTILERISESYKLATPHHLWAEQDPSDWWMAFCNCTRGILGKAGSAKIWAISICSQEICSLAVDKNGDTVYPAMIWADSRAHKEADTLEKKLGASEYYSLTGMRAAANYPVAKIMWLKENRPELYEKTFRFINPKDYLNFKLTGRFATDPECAAYMHLTDIGTGNWSQTLLDAAEIDSLKLAEIIPAGEQLETVSRKASFETGIPEGTPVIMGMGDGGGATLGTGALDKGDAYTSLGTSSWVCAVSGSMKTDPQRRISKIRYLDTFRDSGTMQTGGYSLNWIKNMLRAEYSEINRLAEISRPGANGVLFLPHLIGERSPFWDPRLCGGLLGLCSETTQGDVFRSVMEGVSIHLNLILNIICGTNEIQAIQSMKLVGGGANSSVWQGIFADVFGVPVETVRYPDDACALAVGVIAGTSIGLYPSLSIVKKIQKSDVVIDPNPVNEKIYKELSQTYLKTEEYNRKISRLLSVFKA